MFDYKSFLQLTADASGFNTQLFVMAEDLKEIVNFDKEKWQKGFEEYRNEDVVRFIYRTDSRNQQIYLLFEIFKNAVRFNRMR